MVDDGVLGLIRGLGFVDDDDDERMGGWCLSIPSLS